LKCYIEILKQELKETERSIEKIKKEETRTREDIKNIISDIKNKIWSSPITKTTPSPPSKKKTKKKDREIGKNEPIISSPFKEEMNLPKEAIPLTSGQRVPMSSEGKSLEN